MTELAEPGRYSLSVVMPVLNEMSGLASIVASLKSIAAEQVVIVDGGSDDGSYEWLLEHWQGEDPKHILLQGAQCRAAQMNQGAKACKGDVMLFLHADTILPVSARQEINTARSQRRLWGRFNIRFTPPSFAMSVIAFFMNLRSRLSGVATGDQAIFIEAELFKQIDGYQNIPLMEDVEICKRLKQYCQPYCSKQKVVSSARRWQKNGLISTVLLMWKIRLAFFFGASAESLSRSYRNVR